MKRTKEEQIIINTQFINNYELVDKQFICKKCNSIIKTQKIKHFEKCSGIFVRSPIEKEIIKGSIKKIEKNLVPIISKPYVALNGLCVFGCGQCANFFYNNGKSYCCSLGNNCPIKKKKDSDTKKGKNPFEGKEHPRGGLGKKAWNRGLTKETHPSLIKLGQAISKTFALKGDQRKVKTHTPESKAKIAKATKDRKQGGYKPGSGIGKKGWYKGYWCDSSWELAYVIYCLEHNICIVRNLEHREYMWNNKVTHYIPDFIVQGELQEIKGYSSPQWEAKLEANPDVKVLYGPDLVHVFKYVKGKYGKDFIKLYEPVKEGCKY
jgi:hypothetical protein